MAIGRVRITVLEMFVIVVLVAAIAAVGVWRYSESRTRENVEIMQDDLRNLAAAQEAYAADNGGVFMPRNSRVTTTMHYHGYAPSRDVTVNIAEAGAGGWSATATHERVPGRICGIFSGDSTPGPPNPATTPGDPACN